MKIYIKNMVCNRCIMAVENVLLKLDLKYDQLQLGEVELIYEIDEDKKLLFKSELEFLGFEIIDDRKSKIIEKIKSTVINTIHHSTETLSINFSYYLSEKLGYDYKYLSKLFSEIEGMTIEQYCIAQKIEKVKEYIVYNDMSLSEISFQLGYSSVAHLSNQFKKVTGLTPSHFKKIKENKRKPLDKVKIM